MQEQDGMAKESRAGISTPSNSSAASISEGTYITYGKFYS